jgi:sulfur relay (sulfurtransferase) DsrC/TusE family protein
VNQFDQWIARQRRRLSLGVFLTAFTDALALFLLVLGSSVLLVKLARPGLWPGVLCLAALVLPLSAWAWWKSRQRGFSRAQAVALLDSKTGVNGLLMTLCETTEGQANSLQSNGHLTDVTGWSEHLAAQNPDWQMGLPRLRPVRAARRLWLPVLFVVGCCFVPLREARTESLRTNFVGTQAAESLAQTLQVLRENEVLEQKESENLQQAIDKLAAETKNTPLTHESWEVVDSLRETMRVRAEESLMAASKAQDALDRLGEDAKQNASSLSAERRDQLEQEVAESLRKLSKSGRFDKASPELQKKLQQLMKDNHLSLPKDAKEREKMLSDLKKFLKDESKKIAKARHKEGDSEDDQEGDDSDSDKEDRDGKPGRGGTTRGGAAAKLTWGDDAEANGAKFKEIVLPPGTPDQPDKEIISQSASAPEVEPASSAPRTAGRTVGAESGRQTWNRTLSPRHRAAVRHYFDTRSTDGNDR